MEGGRVARHASKEKIGVDDDALKGRPKLMDTFSPRERSLPEGGLHFFFFFYPWNGSASFVGIFVSSCLNLKKRTIVLTYRIGKGKNRLSKSYPGQK